MDLSALPSRIAALELEGSPKAIAIIKYFTDVLDGKAVIPGGIKMLIDELACDGGMELEIDDAHFPGADAFVSIEGVVPVEIDMELWYETEATAYLAGLNPPMEPAMPHEGIKWAAKNPEAQRANPLVISGQKCLNSDCFVSVIVLRADDRGRRAILRPTRFRFERRDHILAKPKKVVSGQ